MWAHKVVMCAYIVVMAVHAVVVIAHTVVVCVDSDGSDRSAALRLLVHKAWAQNVQD